MRTSFLLLIPLLGCRVVSEPDTKKAPEPASNKTELTSDSTKLAAILSSMPKASAAPPVEVPWTPSAESKKELAEALKTNKLEGGGKLTATIDTTLGAITCALLEEKAPATVANFIGLATGSKKWKDPKGEWVTKPGYDNTTFHRVIPGFMIQGGDPKGDGSGEPGYVIADEIWTGAKHDRAGLLCMANRGPDTNGQQFFITDGSAPHLDGNPMRDQKPSYTIFGECAPLDTVHKIAMVPTAPGGRPGEQSTPKEKIGIKTVRIKREK